MSSSPVLPLEALSDLDHRVDCDLQRRRGALGNAVVVTASPYASRVGIEVLGSNGTAADAVLAIQAMLTLVEPNASGLGGGAVIVWHDARDGQHGVIDGLSAAPAEVTERLEVDFDGRIIPRERALIGGRTVGIPGGLRALECFHARFGKKSWGELLEPAMKLAREGFTLPPYLHKTICELNTIQDEPLVHRVFCGDAHRVLPIGTRVRNPDLAHTLQKLAVEGPAILYGGSLGEEIIAKTTGDVFASRMTIADFEAYEAVERRPLRYKIGSDQVLTAPAPVFGGAAAGQIVSFMDALGFGEQGPTSSAEALHALLEAGRIAFADRGAYAGDPDFGAPDLAPLLDRAYIESRARSFNAKFVANAVEAGRFGGTMSPGAPGGGLASVTTSHIVVADRAGLTVSMTTTLNQNFGSRLSVGGFFLNNAMTNFARFPGETDQRSNNAMAPRKRPMTSFAPTIILGPSGDAKIVLGAGGGNRIVGFVANALMRYRSGYTDAQQIVTAPQALNWNGLSDLEPGVAQFASALAEKGHFTLIRRMDGGTQMAIRREDKWNAGGDTRRDSCAMALNA